MTSRSKNHRVCDLPPLPKRTLHNLIIRIAQGKTSKSEVEKILEPGCYNTKTKDGDKTVIFVTYDKFYPAGRQFQTGPQRDLAIVKALETMAKEYPSLPGRMQDHFHGVMHRGTKRPLTWRDLTILGMSRNPGSHKRLPSAAESVRDCDSKKDLPSIERTENNTTQPLHEEDIMLAKSSRDPHELGGD